LRRICGPDIQQLSAGRVSFSLSSTMRERASLSSAEGHSSPALPVVQLIGSSAERHRASPQGQAPCKVLAPTNADASYKHDRLERDELTWKEMRNQSGRRMQCAQAGCKKAKWRARKGGGAGKEKMKPSKDGECRRIEQSKCESIWVLISHNLASFDIAQKALIHSV
jgi:hypothetical protein